MHATRASHEAQEKTGERPARAGREADSPSPDASTFAQDQCKPAEVLSESGSRGPSTNMAAVVNRASAQLPWQRDQHEMPASTCQNLLFDFEVRPQALPGQCLCTQGH